MPDKAPYKLTVKLDGARPEKIAEALAQLREFAGDYDLTGESTATMTIESWQEAPLAATMGDFELWLYRHAPGLVKDQGMVLAWPGLRPETAEMLAREKKRTPMDSEGWEAPAEEARGPIIIAPQLQLAAPSIQIVELATMDAAKYPADWKAIALAIKETAQWICQDCGRQCRQPGETFDTHRRTTSVHHVGVARPDGSPGDPHDKMDVRAENLLALCSRCHLLRDLPIHAQHAAETRRRKRLSAGQMELGL